MLIGAKDVGGSILVHVFGAFFGIAGSYFFYSKKAVQDPHQQYKYSYYSALLALIGTVFMFCYFPSFNSVLATTASEQQRCVLNTLLSITASVISSILVSRILTRRLDIMVLVYGSISGGVAIGAAANLIAYPFCSMIIGFVAGIVTAIGYIIVAPIISRKLYIHDTYGV